MEPFFTSWMQRHQELSALMGKPLILEELGKSVTANSTSDALQASILNVRQPFMEMVYGQFNQSLQTGNVWRGEPPGPKIRAFSTVIFEERE